MMLHLLDLVVWWWLLRSLTRRGEPSWERTQAVIAAFCGHAPHARGWLCVWLLERCKAAIVEALEAARQEAENAMRQHFVDALTFGLEEFAKPGAQLVGVVNPPRGGLN